MITLEREKASAQFDKFWNDLTQEWFKIEVLQDYSGEDNGPSLTAWMHGDQEESIRLMMNEAQHSDWFRSKPEIKKIRIHIVEEPYSVYLKWEIEHYKVINIHLGGEAVYLVSRSEISDLEIPNGDVMIFDNSRVIKNTYENGKMISADFYEKGEDIGKFLKLKERLMQLGKRV